MISRENRAPRVRRGFLPDSECENNNTRDIDDDDDDDGGGDKP